MMKTYAKYYYESHITIEPVFDERLQKAKDIADLFGFKVAALLMKKREEDTETRSKYDTFMTGHGTELSFITARTKFCIEMLKERGFTVWRYKIEDTVMDSRIDDVLGLL